MKVCQELSPRLRCHRDAPHLACPCSQSYSAPRAQVVTTQGLKVDPATDVIEVDGKPVFTKTPVQKLYFMINKPKVCLTMCPSMGWLACRL